MVHAILDTVGPDVFHVVPEFSDRVVRVVIPWTIELELFWYTGKLDRQQVKAHVGELRATADMYALQNLDWSGQYLLDSLSPSLRFQVLTLVNVTASGPKVLMATIQVVESEDTTPPRATSKRRQDSSKGAQSAGNNRTSGSSDSSKSIECGQCNRKGHIRKDCPHKDKPWYEIHPIQWRLRQETALERQEQEAPTSHILRNMQEVAL